MKTSDKGINFIKGFESFRSVAYQDSGGVWTNGWGHTFGVSGVTPPVTEEEATENLEKDLSFAELSINSMVKVELSQNQFDALASFTFNVGAGNLQASTLLKKLNQGDYIGASNEFGRWIYAKGQKLEGLIARREKERQLFLEAV